MALMNLAYREQICFCIGGMFGVVIAKEVLDRSCTTTTATPPPAQ
jgi:hypothetical protein